MDALPNDALPNEALPNEALPNKGASCFLLSYTTADGYGYPILVSSGCWA